MKAMGKRIYQNRKFMGAVRHKGARVLNVVKGGDRLLGQGFHSST